MHLPAVVRRRIVYATAATLLIGGLALGARTAPQGQDPETEALAAAPSTSTEPDNAPDTMDAQRVEYEGAVPLAGKALAPSVTQAEESRPKVTTYAVAEGDTLSTIADRFGLQAESILWTNGLSEDEVLQIGQELKIPALDGVVHTVASGDTLWDIASDFGTDFDKIVAANPDIDAEALQPGDMLLIPGGQPVAPRLANMVASRGVARTVVRGSGFGLWPLGGVVTDYFGWRTHPVYGTDHFHDGMDIGVAHGTPVASVAGGTVDYVGWVGGYGLIVKVDHGGGVVTMYAHLSEAAVEVGQSVTAGDLIAYSGNTGASTGPHLHFTVFVDGSPVDPSGWLP